MGKNNRNYKLDFVRPKDADLEQGQHRVGIPGRKGKKQRKPKIVDRGYPTQGDGWRLV